MTPKTLTLCITCCDKDYFLLSPLLELWKKQSRAPNEIIISCSGLKSSELNHPQEIEIKESTIPIHTLCNETRHRQAAARNLGAKNSSCEYVMFFDVDDLPHSEKIELCMKYVDNYDFLLHSFGPLKPLVYDANLVLGNLSINPNNTNLRSDVGGRIPHSHITVNRDVFDSINFREGKKAYRKEDGLFCQDLVKGGYQGIYLPFPLIHYESRRWKHAGRTIIE